MEIDCRETGVGVFKLPSRSFAGTSAGGGHRKNGCRSESVGDMEQHTPSAGGGRAKTLRSDSCTHSFVLIHRSGLSAFSPLSIRCAPIPGQHISRSSLLPTCHGWQERSSDPPSPAV